MSQTISLEGFVRGLSESGLLSGAELSATLDGLDGNAGGSDARDLARSLIEAGRLTPFQADAILEGRVPELRIGSYIVLKQLGAGGMGTVYQARHRTMHRIVALKILSRGTAVQSSLAQRFQREVETIAQLSHPNIVMAFDAGEDENGLYLVMEFVDGRDLSCEVAQGGPLSIADATDCILQAARGLACAHDHGIVHRDVKPANLLRDRAGVVKVADLGLARLTSAEISSANSALTQAGNVLGTADYIAPEQALDSATVDHRADVYSLGCSLFFLLTGRPPYSAGSLMALLLKHRDAPIPSLCEARPNVPAELDRIYLRMAAKRPEDRYSTMTEVVRDREAERQAIASLSDDSRTAARAAAGATPADVTMLMDPAIPVASADLRPTQPASGSGDAPTLSNVRRVADLTVVLVEPSRAQANIVRKYLQKLGIEKVRVTSSGREALEVGKQEGTDVILSSMHLADMTGVQLAQALHDDPGYSRVGFVLASSESDDGEAIKVLNAPFTVLLPKPFDLRRLAQALAQASGLCR
jgi:serine/threonine-protein kinase